MKTLLLFSLSLFSVGCMKDTVSEDISSFLSTESAKIEGGTWVTSCFALQAGGTQKRTASFANGTYVETLTNYSDTCSTKVTELGQTGTYVIGTVLGPDNSAIKLDRKIATYTVRPLTSAIADSYNAVSFCGLTNWTVEVAVNILGRICEGSAMPAIGAYYYDIFRISIFENGKMSFGYNDSTYDGSTPGKRPISLLAYPFYIRQ
jgi:hypothetical protein